ncbi:MAG: helix-turn-helix transcriptional regulator [Bacteroidota bacterium]
MIFYWFSKLYVPHFSTRQAALALTILTTLSASGQNLDYTDVKSNPLLNQANQLRFQNPDSARVLYLMAIKESKAKGDSSQAIQGLINLSFHYSQNANFLPAYDGYWEALSMADNTNDSLAIAQVYEGLGWLYSLFSRLETGKSYFEQSVNVGKQLVERGELEKSSLLNAYYGLAVMHRNAFKNDLARQYIDTCNMVRLPTDAVGKAFTNIELAFVLGNEGKYQESLDLINMYRGFFEEKQPSYLVIIDSFLGGIYYKIKQLKKSEEYYLNALEAGAKYKSHQDLIPDIYEHLSRLYSETNRDEKAYEFLVTAKSLEEEQFGPQSENNQKIMAITDKYRIAQENRQRELEKQKIKKLEQEAEIYSLKSLLLYLTVIFLTILIFVIYRFLRTRHKAQKAAIRLENEVKLEKAREVLEFKNKELTASTLQLIERDELLADLREKLKAQRNGENGKEIGKLVTHIDINKSHNWDEFNARFISVNSKFYDNLKESFPKLSQGDKKICALIKLNFSSKDMSRLLGISVESVHTTRYRLRKKLNLSRQDNLEDFVATF